MSRTLNLVDYVLARGRKLHQIGVEDEALRAFTQLARFRELEPEVAKEIQSTLAEILLQRGKFHRARRHLAAALAHQPDNPHYHHLMAAADLADAFGQPERALDSWRRALALEPDQPNYLSAFGLLAVREGQTEQGLTALRRAHELAPDDPAVLAKLAEGLCHAGQHDEARTALRAALFRNGRDHRFRDLWDTFQFQQLRAEQESARHRRQAGTPDDGPAVLPFVRPSPTGTGGKTIRRDRAGRRAPPHFPAQLPGRKHA
jgi:Tfp pilus assembly protein PilF